MSSKTMIKRPDPPRTRDLAVQRLQKACWAASVLGGYGQCTSLSVDAWG
jgi:hypothetical protein